MNHIGRSRVLLLVLVAVLIQFSHGYKQELSVHKDSRDQFFIESFGYKEGGVFKMNISDFKVVNKHTKGDVDFSVYKNEVYFLQFVTSIESPEYLQPDSDFKCPQPEEYERNMIPVQNWGGDSTVTFEYKVSKGDEGSHNLYFINCNKTYYVNFKLHLEEYNVDSGYIPNYLPVGLSYVPSIYGMLSLAYVVAFFIWVFGYMRAKGTILNKVHYLMAILVVLKFLSMLFYSIEQHYVKYDGKPGGWVIAYYIFAVLKTGFFFVILTLIGTGWSFFKPFLSDKDKKIIMIVVPLQILDNIALVIVGVDDPGSQGLFTWVSLRQEREERKEKERREKKRKKKKMKLRRKSTIDRRKKDIFRLVDIICCGAILIPIIWSIKHLREASQSDGKAARNLQKLHLFRQFYLIVVSYIYFTRIIVYLLDATLEYDLLYLGDVFTELATLTFFLVVGYKFRPVSGNPYFKMEEEDAIRMEEMRNAELENNLCIFIPPIFTCSMFSYLLFYSLMGIETSCTHTLSCTFTFVLSK